MYHLPPGKKWDAGLLIKALQKRGIEAHAIGDTVYLTLPIAAIDTERLFTASSSPLTPPSIVGEAVAELSYLPEKTLGNITLKLPQIERYPTTYLPRITVIREALADCGYDYGSERELAKKYSPSDVHPEIDTILNEVEKLDTEKYQAVEEGRIVDAAETLARQRSLRKQMEQYLLAK